jgi:thiamine-monophosphate kinase
MDGDTLASAGERAALKRIIARLPSAAAIEGPGDDAAVLAAPDGRYVVSTDLRVHGPDFRLAWSSFEDLGWKAAASNLADIAAMGARPTALVVALVAPPSTPVADLEALADGLRLGCEALAPAAGVVGGDLSTGDVLTIAVTVFGDLEGRAPVLRRGARPGDVLAVAGPLGRAATGLRLLFRDAVDADGVPDEVAFGGVARDHPDLISAQLRPTPPIAAGVAAAEAGGTAMLDISDGLLLDAGRIAEASGVAIDLDSGALAEDVERISALAPDLASEAFGLALSGGEDHALLAAFPGPPPSGFRAIGRVLDGSGVTVDGADPSRARAGWDPFDDWDGAAG